VAVASTDAGWPIVSRAEVADRLWAAVTAGLAGGSGPVGAVLAGSPGAGKTVLARECVERATASGHRVEWVVGSPATASIPLGALGPLLPEPVAATSPERLLHGAFQAFRTAVSGRRMLLAVDDLQWLDEVSAALINRLAEAGDVAIVGTMRSRTPAPQAVTDLWRADRVERIELDPWTRTEVEKVLAAALGGGVDMATAQEFWRVSAGNPLYLRELFLAAAGGGLLGCQLETWSLHAPLPASDRLAELIESRLAGLADTERDALELIAVGEPIALRHVERLIDLEVLAQLEAGALIGVTSEAGPGGREDVVRLGHPVFGEVLRDGMARLRTRQAQVRLAAAVAGSAPLGDADLERVVRWQLDAGAPATTADLEHAARTALERFDIDLTRRCAAEILRLGPHAPAGLLLGRAMTLAGEHADAERVLLDAAALADNGALVGEIATARADLLFHWLGRPEDGRRIVTEAAAQLDPGSAQRAVLRVREAAYDLYDGAPEAAANALAGYLDHDDPRIVLDAAMIAAVGEFALGHFAQAGRWTVAGRKAAGELGGTSITAAGFDLAPLFSAELGIALHAGRYGEVEKEGLRAHQAALDEGSPTARAWIAHLVAAGYMAQGRMTESIRWFRESVAATATMSAASLHHIVVSGLAGAQAWAGDVAAARATLRGLDEVPGRSLGLFGAHSVRARAWILAAEGAHVPAAEMLIAGAEPMRRADARTFEVAMLYDAVRIDRDAAARVAPRIAELATLVEGPLMVARADLVGSLVDGDPDGTEAAAHAFTDLGGHLYAAEAAASAAVLAARRGKTRQAAALTRYAGDLAARCEGAATPGMHRARTDSVLTPRERQIAFLAADGMRTKEIAGSLFLSDRTVDNVLGRVFTKLGIAGRAELAESLRTAGVT
jgi:DNA-binding CsgD family transcriptional regulator